MQPLYHTLSHSLSVKMFVLKEMCLLEKGASEVCQYVDIEEGADRKLLECVEERAE